MLFLLAQLFQDQSHGIGVMFLCTVGIALAHAPVHLLLIMLVFHVSELARQVLFWVVSKQEKADHALLWK